MDGVNLLIGKGAYTHINATTRLLFMYMRKTVQIVVRVRVEGCWPGSLAPSFVFCTIRNPVKRSRAYPQISSGPWHNEGDAAYGPGSSVYL